MILSTLKIFPAPAREEEVLDILLSVRGPTLAAAGCLECSIYQEHDDERAIIYLEKWVSRREMISHIRSTFYQRLLKALELSHRQPEICFYDIATTYGIELIEKERSSLPGARQ
jgi:quinol monooxygenase YgiN